MCSFPTNLFARACRAYLTLAYPDGAVPPQCQPFLHLGPDACLDHLLAPPVCEKLADTTGDARPLHGYAFRLGSCVFPHIKLKVVWHEASGHWLFGVDTHDAIRLSGSDPKIQQLRDLQEKNRRLKEQVEEVWETAGLLTFNAILRRALDP